jgi:hypothetical protein
MNFPETLPKRRLGPPEWKLKAEVLIKPSFSIPFSKWEWMVSVSCENP